MWKSVLHCGIIFVCILSIHVGLETGSPPPILPGPNEVTSEGTLAHYFYRYLACLFNKSRTLLLELISLTWRFLDIHLHKIIVFLLFVMSLSQISIAYWVVMLLLVFIVPLPYVNKVMFPLVTLFLGAITVVKSVFQFPIISETYFEFSGSHSNCTSMKVRNTQRHNTIIYNYAHTYIHSLVWAGCQAG